MTQEEVFLDGEGNRWYERNRDVLTSRQHQKDDPVLRMIDAQGLRPRHVLEIGCSNGWRLNALHRRYECVCVGIDPSQKALRAGQRAYPELGLRQGTINAVPLASDEIFDLVIVSFVLHWVDRASLMTALAEIDRRVEEGGFLVISDFLPEHPVRVPYRHREDVCTYCADYAGMFLSTGLYELPRREIFPTPGGSVTHGAISLLEKIPDSYTLLEDYGQEKTDACAEKALLEDLRVVT